VDRTYLKGDFQQSRSYSRAVVVRDAGTTVYLAGVGCPRTPDGASLGGDFEAQARGCFQQLEGVLAECGGALGDVVTMTVYVTDIRYGDAFIPIRTEAFGDNFPASTLVGVESLAVPDMLVEIEAVAVLEK